MKKSRKIKFIPVNVPKIFKEDKINIQECLDKGWVSSEGSFVKKKLSNFRIIFNFVV